jgi:ubiquinone/menaquinone biosynthesis C-methylase UbiE
VADQWNHNIHYHPVVMAAIPSRCDSALDVGCGTGLLTRKLSAVVPHVTGVDRDEQSITIARSLAGPASGIEYVHGDFRHLPLQDGSFGLVTAVASLHHMDAAAALTRMRDLLRPGGALVVIGLARTGRSPRDLAPELPAAVAHWILLARHRASRRNAPASSAYQPPLVWPPADTYRDIRRIAGGLLPGMRYRRHLLWRYSICWQKPGGV